MGARRSDVSSFKIQVSGMDIVERLKEFMENEARSGSMDFGCVTPIYVYRAWGGSVSIEEIELALNYLKTNNHGY